MTTFRLPDLGEGLAEAEIVQWHVKVGDQVRVDEPMVSVETAKAVVEVPAPFTGTVIALRGAPGDIIATGAPLIDFDAGTVVGRMPDTVEEREAEPAPAPRQPRADAARQRAVPAARALARRLQVDLAAIAGTGRDGLITVDDVLAHSTVGPGAATAGGSFGAGGEPLRGMRRAMAQSMTQSHSQVAGSTVCDDADVHGWKVRGDYMWRLVRALREGRRLEPALNAWYDAGRQARKVFAHIHLAIAVDTPDGLIVPVIRNVEALLREPLLAAVTRQKEAALSRSVKPGELRDFTFMLSNFGTLSGRYGTPLVVPPAVAILGAGKVREEAVAVSGHIEARMRMPLSLSFDHRCITGGEACRFLAAVIADLEKPD